MRNHDRPSILDVKVKCPACGWIGLLRDTELDDDGGSCPQCPECMCVVMAVEVKWST